MNDWLIQLIKDLQQQVYTLDMTTTRTNQGTANGPPNPKIPRNHSNYSNIKNLRHRNTSKYCWLDRVCSHNSKHCNTKNNGHKYETIFVDKMGGSESYCYTEAE